ncbi:Auxin responsive SAUR protein [Corchorus olitorius]|uniref:Auxin responsive SAUR protein n=1 Tax=Corchorus olitorius TaxID=93759 RepID=A0A1R3GWP0_9ROSI|nr:Auxin responsive SAUR protein [Corchorus olitorius]
MYSASKICSLVKKLGHGGKSKNSYNRLAPESDDAKAIHYCRRGYVVMYVGEEGKRYQVPIKFLSCPTFIKQVLMQISQEDDVDDLDPKIDGPIMIRHCTPETLEQILKASKHHI